MAAFGRRRFIIGAGTVAALALGGGSVMAMKATSPALRLTSLDDLLLTLDRIEAQARLDPAAVGALRAVRGGWSLERTFIHCAQSLEFAVSGFPQMKPPLFRATAGRLALGFFTSRGAMAHGLGEPIPGAPELADGPDVLTGLDRLRSAVALFRAHEASLQPHFAYGSVEPTAYGQVQAMHVANHLDAFPDLLPHLT
jgi:hypothetical protein